MTDGQVALIRGSTTYTVLEGVKLQPGDILRTEAKGQAQVEFQDGTIVNFGPGAQALLVNLPPLPGARGEAEIAVLSGWVKFTQKRSGAGPSFRYLTPVASLTSKNATAALHGVTDLLEVFVESGSAQLAEPGKAGAAGISRDLKGGDFVVRRSDRPAEMAPRPTAEFVGAMPRHFQDDLPVRIDRLKNVKAEPRREHDVTYAEVEGWLRTSLPVRKPFVERFRGRANDSDFRKGLIRDLREHPEWDRVLFPEKYLPTPTPGP